MTISTSFRLPTARIELRESPVTGGRRLAAARVLPDRFLSGFVGCVMLLA